MGTANPMPMLPPVPDVVAMAVLTPGTQPWRSTSGPPELPGLMDASVCTIGRVPPGARGAVDGADDACGDGTGQAERRTDGDDGLSDLEGPAGAELGGGGGAAVDAQHGDVLVLVAADDACADPAIVGEHEGHLGGAVDDVLVGDHVTGAVDYEAGARRPSCPHGTGKTPPEWARVHRAVAQTNNGTVAGTSRTCGENDIWNLQSVPGPLTSKARSPQS